MLNEDAENKAQEKVFDYQLNILRDEISLIHARIGAFDDLSFRVKGWAGTSWAVLVGYGVSAQRPWVTLLAVPLMCVFWYVDALFKSYQRRVRARMGVIERFLNSRSTVPGKSLLHAVTSGSFHPFIVHDPMCYQTANSDQEFAYRLAAKIDICRTAFTRNVWLIYVGLMGVAMAIAIVLGAAELRITLKFLLDLF